MGCSSMKDEGGFILPSVLMISFLIISLLLSLFVALYFRQLIEIKKINKKKLDLACFSAIERHLVSAGMKLKSGREVIKRE